MINRISVFIIFLLLPFTTLRSQNLDVKNIIVGKWKVEKITNKDSIILIDGLKSKKSALYLNKDSTFQMIEETYAMEGNWKYLDKDAILRLTDNTGEVLDFLLVRGSKDNLVLQLKIDEMPIFFLVKAFSQKD